MGATTNKLKYIGASLPEEYANLGEEILSLHTKISKNSSSDSEIIKIIEELRKAIDEMDGSSDITSDIVSEVENARGIYDSLKEHLDSIKEYGLTDVIERLSSERKYDYNNAGNIAKESVRGDLEYDTVYVYDSDGENIVKEEIRDIAGRLIGSRDYIYDDNDNVVAVNSTDADIINTVTNSLHIREINERLKEIEEIDFIKTADIINSESAKILIKSVQDILARLESLELSRPDDITGIINIPDILRRLDALEKKMDIQHTIFEFVVNSDILVYEVPEEVTSKTAVYIEGLLLSSKVDYKITEGKISFYILLIDGFVVTCKY